MIRALQITVLSCAALLLTGCNEPEKSDNLWRQVKIGDIAPTSPSGKHPGGQALKTINFNIYIFEIPAGNIGMLNEVWSMLYTAPLKFNDYEAFSANSFVVGFGQVQMWNKIRYLLTDAGGKKVETVSFLLTDGQANEFAITELYAKQTIFYLPTAGSLEGVTIGPGTVGLRIKTEKIPGSRGVSNTAVLPVFSSSIRSPIPQLDRRLRSGDFSFACCRFELKMSPGDFIFLGPEKYIGNQITLAGRLFDGGGRKPAVRGYLIVCTSIND